VIEVEWGTPKGRCRCRVSGGRGGRGRRPAGLLRDISEVFAKEKMNVIGVQTQSVKGTAWMTFTVEVPTRPLAKVLGVVAKCRACARRAGAEAARPFVRLKGKKIWRGLAASFFPAIIAVSDKLRRVAQLVRAPP
jgi:hypothetical protein